MSLVRRDGGEIEALITDRYLDSLLAIQASPQLVGGPLGSDDSLSAAVRAVSRRLATDLPRFHPSFRFEERLALRLAEVAASMRLPVAAGAEGQVVPFRDVRPGPPDRLRPAGDEDERDARPLLIGGAVAASALSLAGAWLAWRRRTSPMARAIRAAHSMRQPGAGA
ncbi:MAG TPA: hypothetical protein VL749_04665 [Patescibacteria group bacterium]|nr:hypothetical protein [Patescibacteria group bacterium]